MNTGKIRGWIRSIRGSLDAIEESLGQQEPSAGGILHGLDLHSSRTIKRIFLHYSYSDNPSHDSVAWARDLHVNTNGWSDIGYHFWIRKDGTIETGRPINRKPAAQRGNNSNTIAICLHGKMDYPTERQARNVRTLCRELHKIYPTATFHGHKEVVATSCPGDWDYRTTLGLDSQGRMNS